ncbi:MAG: hypothetical protein SNF33_06055 [Candidatus Algichlamydia australiensis]|nr:hypothetical protein [Chlamydiales bacterium]
MKAPSKFKKILNKLINPLRKGKANTSDQTAATKKRKVPIAENIKPEGPLAPLAKKGTCFHIGLHLRK